MKKKISPKLPVKLLYLLHSTTYHPSSTKTNRQSERTNPIRGEYLALRYISLTLGFMEKITRKKWSKLKDRPLLGPLFGFIFVLFTQVFDIGSCWHFPNRGTGREKDWKTSHVFMIHERLLWKLFAKSFNDFYSFLSWQATDTSLLKSTHRDYLPMYVWCIDI